MKHVWKYGLFIFVFSIGCDKEPIPPETEPENLYHLTEGFCIQFGDSVIINHEEIDYYDFSTHMIYLKENHEFLKNYNWDLAYMSFSIYADNRKVYTGYLHPGYSSMMPLGAFIDFPFFYPEYTIKISHSSENLYQGINREDLRGDEVIVNTLKTHEQYHAGLASSIDEIDIQQSGGLSFNLTITNKDTFNYYILSPDKMGVELFHFFTMGLLLTNDSSSWLHHKCPVLSPEPWDSWNTTWLDLIMSGESKSYSIQYEDFDSIPLGQYQGYFDFPGLFNVEIEDIVQSKGRIWLGEIKTNIDIHVE